MLIYCFVGAGGIAVLMFLLCAWGECKEEENNYQAALKKLIQLPVSGQLAGTESWVSL